MIDYTMRTVRVGLILGALAGMVGCADQTDEGVQGHNEFGIEITNGIIPVNGLVPTNGMTAVNGVSPTNGMSGTNGVMGTNGMSPTNGMISTNGISETSGYITTDAGRKTLAYLIKCALPSGHTITKAGYQFQGGIGLCPQWEWGSVVGDRTCQNLVSACLMAHINTSGVHVPLWIDSENSLIGWGTNASYPKQEGTFFGNILMTGNLSNLAMPQVNAPAAYFCEGAGITAGAVSGRLGSGQSGAPYTNPYGQNVKCQGNQNTVAGPTSPGMSAPDGYKQACANGYCWQNGEPITVWRNPNYVPTFDTVYAYDLQPAGGSGLRMDVNGDGTTIEQDTKPSGGPAQTQQFKVLSDGAGNWNIKSKDQSKCVGSDAKGTANGTKLKLQPCAPGDTSQTYNITANANDGTFALKHVASGRCVDVPNGSTSPGQALQLYDCWGGGPQKFKMGASY